MQKMVYFDEKWNIIMDTSKSVIISFEGLDCSFKETNYNSFVTKLQELRDPSGYMIHAESFPRYNNPIVYPVNKWLNGDFDRDILKHYPKAVCSLYSIDRMDYWYGLQDGSDVRNYTYLNGEDGKFHYFVFDRYNLSNVIYNPIGLDAKYNLIHELQTFGNPNPDIIVWMRVKNFDTLISLISKKKNKDKNECDIDFLRDKWKTSEDLINSGDIQKFMRSDLIIIDIIDECGNIKPKDNIFDEVWQKVNAAVARRCFL